MMQRQILGVYAKAMLVWSISASFSALAQGSPNAVRNSTPEGQAHYWERWVADQGGPRYFPDERLQPLVEQTQPIVFHKEAFDGFSSIHSGLTSLIQNMAPRTMTAGAIVVYPVGDSDAFSQLFLGDPKRLIRGFSVYLKAIKDVPTYDTISYPYGDVNIVHAKVPPERTWSATARNKYDAKEQAGTLKAGSVCRFSFLRIERAEDHTPNIYWLDSGVWEDGGRLDTPTGKIWWNGLATTQCFDGAGRVSAPTIRAFNLHDDGLVFMTNAKEWFDAHR